MERRRNANAGAHAGYPRKKPADQTHRPALLPRENIREREPAGNRTRATSCGYTSRHPVWHALYECLQDIHGDSSPFHLQPIHELSNGFWPRLTSSHLAIQFVLKMFYRVEVRALGGLVRSANIVIGSGAVLLFAAGAAWQAVSPAEERQREQRRRRQRTAARDGGRWRRLTPGAAEAAWTRMTRTWTSARGEYPSLWNWLQFRPTWRITSVEPEVASTNLKTGTCSATAARDIFDCCLLVKTKLFFLSRLKALISTNDPVSRSSIFILLAFAAEVRNSRHKYVSAYVAATRSGSELRNAHRTEMYSTSKLHLHCNENISRCSGVVIREVINPDADVSQTCKTVMLEPPSVILCCGRISAQLTERNFNLGEETTGMKSPVPVQESELDKCRGDAVVQRLERSPATKAPRFLHVGIVPDNTTSRRVYSAAVVLLQRRNTLATTQIIVPRNPQGRERVVADDVSRQWIVQSLCNIKSLQIPAPSSDQLSGAFTMYCHGNYTLLVGLLTWDSEKPSSRKICTSSPHGTAEADDSVFQLLLWTALVECRVFQLPELALRAVGLFVFQLRVALKEHTLDDSMPIAARALAFHKGHLDFIPCEVTSGIFACGNRAWTMLLVDGFLEDLPFPPPLRSGCCFKSTSFHPSSILKTLDVVVWGQSCVGDLYRSLGNPHVLKRELKYGSETGIWTTCRVLVAQTNGISHSWNVSFAVKPIYGLLTTPRRRYAPRWHTYRCVCFLPRNNDNVTSPARLASRTARLASAASLITCRAR
ncbi:hypothetical protein PR048_027444 [Dryococelus australis]|uniref:Uncharacterized protein n=1 Tax=Dryococelus australis TaxID=614101 RepID=A0ABQ9GFG5_9NEOP|nr:hypothetical protein PR048_027444 [Dryococelus australis]